MNDAHKIAKRAASLCGVEVDDIFSQSRQRVKVRARSLYCYWASRELGISHTELARQLRISVPAVGYSVARGELLTKKNRYELIE